MKFRLGAILLLLFLGGCGLFGNSPTSVVGKYLKLSENKQNIEAMENLVSERAKRELGAEKVLIDILSATDFGTKVAATGESMPFLKPEETINSEFATVSFYTQPTWAAQNDKANQNKALLIKENGEWKIYAMGQSGEPNPKANSIYATEIARAFQTHPDLMKTRLIGKTIVVEGDVKGVGDYKDDDSGSIALKTARAGYPDAGYLLCKLKSGGKALYEKNKQAEIKTLKIKGTVVPKDPSDPVSSEAVVVLENCAVQ